MKRVHLARTLGFKLFLLIFTILIVVFIIYSYINIRTHSSHLMSSVIEHANGTGDLIKRSTRYSMLLNRREDVYQIIKTLGNQQGVEGIRIYNKKGEIMFSTNSAEVNTFVDMNAEACNICHASNNPIEVPKVEMKSRIFTSTNGHRVLGIINPIRNDPDCYTAECHFHNPSQTVLGVLDVRMSLVTLDRQIQESKNVTMTIAGLAILITAVLSGLFIWFLVRSPVRKLIIGTQEIGEGNLDYSLDIDSKDEIGLLAESFNAMTRELKIARDEITQWSNTLEEKVIQKTEELKRAQNHLIQIEKMASLGKLSATVAHELNNPLSGILSYTKLNIRRLNKGNLTPEETQSIIRDLTFMADEINRCGNIVKNLLLFSKKKVTEFSVESMDTIIEKACTLIQHHLQIKNVKLEKKLCHPPCRLLCDSQSIQQAVIALFVNAVEAMPHGGTLTVSAQCKSDSDYIEISIRDTGIGIPEKDLPHIFEPFFSTKEDGKGVGLGLAVVYGIIQQHNGEINVSSTIGKGTTFTIILPKRVTESNLPKAKEEISVNHTMEESL